VPESVTASGQLNVQAPPEFVALPWGVPLTDQRTATALESAVTLKGTDWMLASVIVEGLGELELKFDCSPNALIVGPEA
jgi:hypothetical protein